MAKVKLITLPAWLLLLMRLPRDLASARPAL